MASFESKVSEIFGENPRLARKIPIVIRKIFHESEPEFKRRMNNATEEDAQTFLMLIFDALYMDFYFDELGDRFMSWVIENYPERFTASELNEMQAQAESHLDFYEVQKVVQGKGSYIKSLFTETEGFLKDVSASYNFVKRDIFMGRCYFFKGDYYATGSFSVFSLVDKKIIKEEMGKIYLNNDYDPDREEYADFAKNHWDIFYDIKREVSERKKNKKIYINYGEYQPCEVRFQVNDVNTILKKIEQSKNFNFVDIRVRKIKKRKRGVDRYHFEWTTLGIEKELEPIKLKNKEDGILVSSFQVDENGKPTNIELLGDVYIDKYLCRIEIKSVELAEFAVKSFTGFCGNAITFKRIIKKKVDMDVVPEDIGEPAAEKKHTIAESEMLKEVGEKYYLDLLDEKVPALKGMTPREARNDPILLPLLIEWLKDLENMLEHQRRDGMPVISINKIKRELNIDN